MRNILLLLFGLVIGVLGATNIINALRQRDAYPRGLMHVLQQHDAALRVAVRGGQCGPAIAHDLAAMRLLSEDIGTAIYAADTPEAAFREYQGRLRDALAATPTSCTETAAQLEKIDTACEACHRQYR